MTEEEVAPNHLPRSPSAAGNTTASNTSFCTGDEDRLVLHRWAQSFQARGCPAAVALHRICAPPCDFVESC
jgi:hypothetical protein